MLARHFAPARDCGMISATPNMPMTSGSEIDAVQEAPERRRCSAQRPLFTSVPTRPSSRPIRTMRDRLDHRAVRQHDGDDQAEHASARSSPASRTAARPRRAAARTRDEHACRRSRRRTSRAPRPPSAAPARPWLRHLVAVDAGDDRARLARHVDQDRRGRAAILRAVVDAGEHDQRADSGRGRR